MRRNFERFGHYVCLDVMKRGINKLLWPYLAVTLLNDLNKVCVACESIVMAERDQACIAVMDFVIKSAPKRTRENVHVITGDGFF